MTTTDLSKRFMKGYKIHVPSQNHIFELIWSVPTMFLQNNTPILDNVALNCHSNFASMIASAFVDFNKTLAHLITYTYLKLSTLAYTYNSLDFVVSGTSCIEFSGTRQAS